MPSEQGIQGEVINSLQTKLLEGVSRSPKVALQANAMAQIQAGPEKEYAGIKRSIQELESVSDQMADTGLSQPAFAVGVVNVGVTGFVLGRFPEWIWVLYCFKCIVYIPAWFREVSRRQNGALFILDFCWVSNVVMGTYMLVNLVAGSYIPAQVHHWAFLSYFSIALGPLSWAVLVLQNGLVFHSIERSANLFIHFTPTVVAWTLRWSPQTIIAAWPGRFTQASLEEASGGEVYFAGLGFYSCWLVVYATWLLTIGIHMPSKGYATVFDGLYRAHDLGPKIRKLTGFTSLRAHVVVFLAVHALACSIAFLWSILCYKFWLVHTAFMVVLFCAISWMGAGFYMYIFTDVYTKALKKLLPKADA